MYFRSVTDPGSTRPKLWLVFGWLFAACSVACLTIGTWIVIAGSVVGWVNIALGVIFMPQSVLYFRQYRRLRESDRSDEQ